MASAGNRKPVTIISTVISALIVITFIAPLIWMIISSFKYNREVLAVPLKVFPSVWTLENYREVLTSINPSFLRSMLMTFIVSASSVILSLALNMMAAYSFARLDFKFKKLLWVVCISTMYIPGITILISSFLVVSALGMLNTMAVLILPGVISGYNIFFFRQFFLGTPKSLEEAALINGAGRFKIFLYIFLPLAKAPMIILGAGVFIGYWNSFIWPTMTISSKNLFMIMQIIRSYQSQYASNYGNVLAATSMSIIPPLILFALFQKYIVKGMVLSGLK